MTAWVTAQEAGGSRARKVWLRLAVAADLQAAIAAGPSGATAVGGIPGGVWRAVAADESRRSRCSERAPAHRCPRRSNGGQRPDRRRWQRRVQRTRRARVTTFSGRGGVGGGLQRRRFRVSATPLNTLPARTRCRCPHSAAMESYATVGTIEASRDGAPIHLAVFDPTEELLWSASQAGMVYSHLLPTAEPYSAFRADEQMPVVALFPHPFGVITLNHDRVRFFSKGGMKLQEAVDRSKPPGAPHHPPPPRPPPLPRPPPTNTTALHPQPQSYRPAAGCPPCAAAHSIRRLATRARRTSHARWHRATPPPCLGSWTCAPARPHCPSSQQWSNGPRLQQPMRPPHRSRAPPACAGRPSGPERSALAA